MSFFAVFAFGFLTALIIGVAVLYGLYSRSMRKRNMPANIQGYLDLIPDLSGEQRREVREIRINFLPKVESIRVKMRQNRAILAELLFEEPSDRARIDDVASQIIAHQRELEHEVIEHILEEKDLLTPSQRRRFHEIITDQFSSGGLGVHDLRIVQKHTRRN